MLDSTLTLIIVCAMFVLVLWLIWRDITKTRAYMRLDAYISEMQNKISSMDKAFAASMQLLINQCNDMQSQLNNNSEHVMPLPSPSLIATNIQQYMPPSTEFTESTHIPKHTNEQNQLHTQEEHEHDMEPEIILKTEEMSIPVIMSYILSSPMAHDDDGDSENDALQIVDNNSQHDPSPSPSPTPSPTPVPPPPTPTPIQTPTHRQQQQHNTNTNSNEVVLNINELQMMKLAELQAFAQKIGVSPRGNKTKLIERIMSLAVQQNN